MAAEGENPTLSESGQSKQLSSSIAAAVMCFLVAACGTGATKSAGVATPTIAPSTPSPTPVATLAVNPSPVPTGCGTSTFALTLVVGSHAIPLCAIKVHCLVTADTDPPLFAMKVPVTSTATVFIQVDNGLLTTPNGSGKTGDFAIAGLTGVGILDSGLGDTSGWQAISGTVSIKEITVAVPSATQGSVTGTLDVVMKPIGNVFTSSHLSGHWTCDD